MTRIVLAIATALFATTTLFAGTAEACISCEYTPEVVNTPNPNDARRKQKRHQATKKQRAPAVKSQAARKALPSKAKAQQAKPKRAAAPEVAKVEPETRIEPASETETKQVETTGPRLTGSSALMQQSIPQEKDEPVAAADAEHACKKFVPAVGATVSVPCE